MEENTTTGIIYSGAKKNDAQLAIWVTKETKEDYEFLKAHGVKASEHLRQAIVREVARIKAEILKSKVG